MPVWTEPAPGFTRRVGVGQSARLELLDSPLAVKCQLVVYLAFRRGAIFAAAVRPEAAHGDALRGARFSTRESARALRRQARVCSSSASRPFGVSE